MQPIWARDSRAWRGNECWRMSTRRRHRCHQRACRACPSTLRTSTGRRCLGKQRGVHQDRWRRLEGRRTWGTSRSCAMRCHDMTCVMSMTLANRKTYCYACNAIAICRSESAKCGHRIVCGSCRERSEAIVQDDCPWCRLRWMVAWLCPNCDGAPEATGQAAARGAGAWAHPPASIYPIYLKVAPGIVAEAPSSDLLPWYGRMSAMAWRVTGRAML